MSELKGKIDFTLFISATNANPNGDPLNGNRPRINMDGYGEISDVCIKRKIRNRLHDLLSLCTNHLFCHLIEQISSDSDPEDGFLSFF